MDFNVALTSTYRKAYRNCTQSEQKDIDIAIDEWLENPDSKGSNFEKLGFMGNNIFSIRISRGGRIIMAKFDGTYFLLHVDPNQHDKANNWARNKRIDRNVTTGAIQIYSGNVEEVEQEIISAENPDDSQYFFEQYSNEELKIIGIPEEWVSAVKKVRSEDQLLTLGESLPEDAWNYLSSLYDQSIEKEILLAQLRDEISRKPEKLDDQLKIQPGIHLVSDNAELLEVLKQDISLFRLYMHPSQKAFAYGNFKGPQKLIGSAGTGKTVVAMNRAKYLSENLSAGDKPIFFTTYTNALIENIKSIFRAENIPDNQVYVSTIHSLALKYGKRIELFSANLKVIGSRLDKKRFWQNFIKAHPQHAKYGPGFLQEEYEKVIQRFFITSEEDYIKVSRRGRGDGIRQDERQKLWAIFKDFEAYQQYKNTLSFDDLIFKLTKYLKQWPEYRPFSHIVCDEIQDFNNNELRLLRYLVEEKENDLFLCGDPFQNIYKRQLRFVDSDINIRGNRSNKLKVNYRTTEEIRKKAISVIEDFQFEDFSGVPANFQGDTSLISGNEPSVLMLRTYAEFNDFLLKFIKDSFGTIGLHELCITHRTEKGLLEIEEVLNNARIGFIKLGEQSVKDINQLQGRVVLGTMHSLKGLEFKNLIVTGFDAKNFPFKPKDFNRWSESEQREHIKAEHALHYVAFSRAISNLIITGVGEAPE